MISLAASALQTLFTTLDPQSVAQSVAFYELYEDGRALERAAGLLGCTPGEVKGLVRVVNRSEGEFSEEELRTVERVAAHLPNRRLKGYGAVSEEEVIGLPSEEIDLGRALLLSQGAGLDEVRSYSAVLDVMALQILARLPEGATHEQKIRETNRFIFEEMRFRFPPHSLYAQDIDLYTFLPSVMDNHLGVCLGVTALYMAIAQRLDLPLVPITPPGHIFLRYVEGDEEINIETTARGIHMPSEVYLSVNTRALEERSLKEVIGMTHFNQAGLLMHRENYAAARAAYEKALPYMSDDALLKELLGYSLLATGEKKRGEALLKEVRGHLPEEAVAPSNMSDDYLAGRADIEAIRSIFMPVDETRSSIEAKKERLLTVLETCPKFRAGWLQLAVTYVQLHRPREGLEALQTYHRLDPNDPVVEYYLAILSGERRDYPAAWDHLKKAEGLTGARDFSPRALKELRKALTLKSPP